MRRVIQNTLSLLIILLFSTQAFAQPNPVKWTFTARDAGNCQVDIILTGVIDEGWCTYSQFLESEDGPVATAVQFGAGDGYQLSGKATESGELMKVNDPVFGMTLSKFKHKAIFTQRIVVKDTGKPVAGTITYMCCNDDMCIPPKTVDFSVKIPALAGCPAKQ